MDVPFTACSPYSIAVLSSGAYYHADCVLPGRSCHVRGRRVLSWRSCWQTCSPDSTYQGSNHTSARNTTTKHKITKTNPASFKWLVTESGWVAHAVLKTAQVSLSPKTLDSRMPFLQHGIQGIQIHFLTLHTSKTATLRCWQWVQCLSYGNHTASRLQQVTRQCTKVHTSLLNGVQPPLVRIRWS